MQLKARRAALACAIGAYAGVLSWVFWSAPHSLSSDFAQLWAAAGAWRHGADPYSAVGPGRAFDWQFPLLYPLPAVVVALPFSWLPLRVADAVFVALGTGLCAWGITRAKPIPPQLLLFVSTAFLAAVQTSQWSPALIGAALTPAAGFLLAAKPTVGVALLAAYPSRRALAGAALFLLATIVLWPWWVRVWLAGLSSATHAVPPVLRRGGFLILLALWKWRRRETRLLVALACIPQTPVIYEALPLFLVTRRWAECAGLSALTVLVWMLHRHGAPYGSYLSMMDAWGQLSVWFLYLPCTALVLTRANVSD